MARPLDRMPIFAELGIKRDRICSSHLDAAAGTAIFAEPGRIKREVTASGADLASARRQPADRSGAGRHQLLVLLRHPDRHRLGPGA